MRSKYYLIFLISASAILARKINCLCWTSNSFHHGQRSGYVSIKTTAANGTYLAFDVDLFHSYTNPTWNIELFRWSSTPRNPFMKGFVKVVLELSNFTLTCPLPANRYYIRLSADSVPKIFPMYALFQPNARFHLQNRFYEQNPRGNYTLLAELVINLILRSDC
ncbi:uncharacterized protein LOC119650464 isoform X2 [Hermetia illucens]|uniref:uncharacterized protein LOC119650464 isoform X2 n=1 Tax=Hermetia illucens TaxID=343691 RepID=UPI0018CBF4BC|nr:uncharacterized protein LOC119650464 isoform X2 [Hermetia illucens]